MKKTNQVGYICVFVCASMCVLCNNVEAMHDKKNHQESQPTCLSTNMSKNVLHGNNINKLLKTHNLTEKIPRKIKH